MRPDDFNIRHLRAVIAIGDTGSVSAAARRVNLTQPAITHAIAKLERLVGLPLFQRRPDGMECTDAGQMLLPRAQAALQFIGNTNVTGTQMRAFIAVARHGSYAAAARAIGLREPSLHRAVSDLSAALGHKLVERRGRGIALTARGLGVARRFRLAESELRSAVSELASLQGCEVGRIAIGAMPLSRARLLPNAVGRFVKVNPDVRIAIVEGSRAELVGPLRDGDIDFMIGALRDSVGDDLIQEPLFVDRPVIIGRRGHPLARGAVDAGIRMLAGYSWIVPAEGTPLRAQWRQMFLNQRMEPPPVTIECGSVIVVRQLLLQGDFLTLLSPDQVAVELEARLLERIGAPPGTPSRTMGLTTRAGWRATAKQRAFLDVVRDEAASLGSRILSKTS
jgi:LysR family transcriptional regulator of gallate degradation